MYERKFTYTSTTHTSTAAYAGNVGKRKNNKTKIAETNSKGCYILKEHPEGATIRKPRASPGELDAAGIRPRRGQKNNSPTVQADMLSACMEYEDILSDKRRGAHPSPPKGREQTPTPNPSPREGGKGQAPTRSGGYVIRLNKRSQVSGARYPPSLGVIDGVASLVEEWGWGWVLDSGG